MKPAVVRRLEHPPHATPPERTPLDARSETEKVLLTDFCNRPTSRAPAVDRPIPGVSAPLSWFVTVRRSKPRRTLPGRSHLTMRSALRPTVPRTPPPIRRVRASLNPGGLRYRRALEGTPLVPRRCLPRARSAGRPLTSPVANELRSLRNAARRQSRSSAEPRQELCLRATRDAFPRRVPARHAAPCEAMSLEREPATGLHALPHWTRLPTLFHRLAPRGGRRLDRGRYQALFTPGRSWPRAARRLLQSKRSASTTCGSRNPDSLGRPACDGSVSRFTNPLPRARLRPMPTRLAPRRHRSRSPVAVRRSAVADPFISELPMV